MTRVAYPCSERRFTRWLAKFRPRQRQGTLARRQRSAVHSGGSYCSQSDLAVTFGLGKDPGVTTLEIEWPSGAKQKLANIAADQFLTIAENQGIIAHSGPSAK